MPQSTRFNELRRRRFVQVAAVYAVAAWAAIQVATSTFPYLGLPAWLVTAVIVLAMIGFPVALLVAWLQERAGAASQPLPRQLSWIVAGVLVALVLAGVARWRLVAGRSASGDSMFASAMLSQVTFSPEVEEFPAFSPDGTRLVFSRETGGFKQLFSRDVVGGEEVQLTHDSMDHIQPSWSPDGRALLYVRAKEATRKLEPSDVFGLYTGGEVWRLDIAARRAQKIIDDAYNASYSPDGTRIAFEASYVGPRRIWVADVMGRNPRQVTTDASEAVSHILPRWSPDGRLLVFQNVEKTKLDIRTVDVATGTHREHHR